MYWYQKNGTCLIAYDDENKPCFFVDFDKEGDGYYWENSHGYGFGLFDTVEQAKKDCERTNPLYFTPKAKELTAEDMAYIKAERERQERIDEGLIW